jgi:hypothetical protein
MQDDDQGAASPARKPVGRRFKHRKKEKQSSRYNHVKEVDFPLAAARAKGAGKEGKLGKKTAGGVEQKSEGNAKLKENKDHNELRQARLVFSRANSSKGSREREDGHAQGLHKARSTCFMSIAIIYSNGCSLLPPTNPEI